MPDPIAAPTLSHQRELGEQLQLGTVKGELLAEHCEELFRIVLVAYRRVVEVNFPRNRHAFRHSRVPVRLVLCLEAKPGSFDHILYTCRASTDRDTVEVYLSNFGDAESSRQRVIVTPVGSVPWDTAEGITMEDLILGPRAPKLEYDFAGAVVRRWVYHWLSSDMDVLERALRKALLEKARPLGSKGNRS